MAPRPRFWIALLGALAIVAGGLYLGERYDDWTHFARSGAVLVILGAVLTAWDHLKAGTNVILMVKTAVSRDRMPSETLGLALMVVGTLIWALGDLVGLVVPPGG